MSSGLARLLGILLVNILPLAGVLFFGWSVFEVLFLYWFENVAVGITQFVRIVICMRTTKAKDGNPVFFLLHYGLFTFVHGVFVVSLFAPEGDAWGLGAGFLAPVAAIMGWQVAALVLDAIRSEGFKDRTPTGLLFEPYPRVLALHITVIAGGFLVMLMGSPVWALAILVALKTLSDLAIAAVLSVGTAAFTQPLRKKRD
jgi:hypothetical protein